MEIHRKIKTVICRYTAFPYDRGKLVEMGFLDIHFTINYHLLLETLLQEIRGMTISYSAEVKRNKTKKKTYLEEHRNSLQLLSEESQESEIFSEMLKEKKLECIEKNI